MATILRDAFGHDPSARRLELRRAASAPRLARIEVRKPGEMMPPWSIFAQIDGAAVTE